MTDTTICPPEHSHGANGTCYVGHKCRCEDCRAGNRVRTAARTRAKAYGRYEGLPYVDAGPAREHVKSLCAYGMGWKRIAEVAGVSKSGINTLLYGRSGARKGEIPKRIDRDKAAKLLAVRPSLDTLAPGAVVTARGTHRRLQALVRQGWTQGKLAERLGIDATNFTRMMRADGVTVRLHRDTVTLFDELWNQTPPHATPHDLATYNRAIRYAKERRWLSPLAWDDLDLDEQPPVAEPEDGIDDQAVALAIAGEAVHLTPAERRAAIRDLHAVALSDVAIARRLHCAERTVLRIRKDELNLPANLAA